MTPGRRPFYKYASPEAVLATLTSGTLRYSTPLLFNDPFDVQGGLHLDFDLQELHGAVVDRIGELAAGREHPPVDPNEAWGQVVLKARSYFPTHGFNRDRWMRLTKAPFDKLLQNIRETQEGYQRHWREVQLPGMRVFCVSEERDSLLMWAHYASDHRGAVLELWSLPEEDNPLSVAVPVAYTDRPIAFYSKEEWIAELVGLKKLDFGSLYRRYASTKSAHWSYEKEWRAWYPLSKTDKFDYSPLRQSEFKAVYLGCQSEPHLRDSVRRLLRERYPGTRLFVARKREGAYALDYTDA